MATYKITIEELDNNYKLLDSYTRIIECNRRPKEGEGTCTLMTLPTYRLISKVEEIASIDITKNPPP